MKKLVLLSFLILSCSPAVHNTKPSAVAKRAFVNEDDPKCTAAPKDLYGAQKADCKVDKDTGEFCCGYGNAVIVPNMELLCGYRICRAECNGEFTMNVALCMPAGQVRQEMEQGQNEQNGTESL